MFEVLIENNVKNASVSFYLVSIVLPFLYTKKHFHLRWVVEHAGRIFSVHGKSKFSLKGLFMSIVDDVIQFLLFFGVMKERFIDNLLWCLNDNYTVN